MFIGYLLFILVTSLFYYGFNHIIIKPSVPIISANKNEVTTLNLQTWITQQEPISIEIMKNNINPPGSVRGFFAASLSTFKPDYFYTWTRDAALVARVLTALLEEDENNVLTFDLLEDYVHFQIHTQQITSTTVCQCLGEPKFNPDGSAFSGSWGRPQNDGPAERVIAFIAIANYSDNYYYVEDVLAPAIIKDLDYITENWQNPCYDLWEEIEGNHFYTWMVMRRALLDAVDFFHSSFDPIKIKTYLSTATQIQNQLESFWSPQRNYIMTTQNRSHGIQKPSGLDVSILLAANLAAKINDGFFTPGSDKILATAVAIEDVFKSLYPLNKQLENKEELGTSIGRYPEDVYDGYGVSIGHPWFIATAAYTELYYLAIQEWQQKGVHINDINRALFCKNNLLDDEDCNHHHRRLHSYHYLPGTVKLDKLIQRTKIAADKFLSTIAYHQHRNGSMSEQFDRSTGFMRGARDLTWSHAAFISAIKARSNSVIF
ncbi:Six-hairpin glycosidase-like protein [Cokeromyces recurvatus]|uniref:Six-hairpin glycosidase-like protein n=1 Tax=Cokeromyces recurvatus TaxID=90255 RepID=UPI00221E433D|nr:Six-hairpin glycosidase-like protein [Cokeromyces recurvatus]KAI7905541.1 Six-hairpin glycosidase-like protein [Cokeromyces recurvatus]